MASTGAPYLKHPRRTRLPRKSKAVLVVDDDPRVREMTAAILEKAGYTVESAGNGRDAVRLIKARSGAPFDLVLTDMMMPEMSGEEMAQSLSGLNPTPKMLFTSGYSDDETLAEDFIPKPCTPAALVRKVRQVIDGPAFPAQSGRPSSSTPASPRCSA